MNQLDHYNLPLDKLKELKDGTAYRAKSRQANIIQNLRKIADITNTREASSVQQQLRESVDNTSQQVTRVEVFQDSMCQRQYQRDVLLKVTQINHLPGQSQKSMFGQNDSANQHSYQSIDYPPIPSNGIFVSEKVYFFDRYENQFEQLVRPNTNQANIPNLPQSKIETSQRIGISENGRWVIHMNSIKYPDMECKEWLNQAHQLFLDQQPLGFAIQDQVKSQAKDKFHRMFKVLLEQAQFDEAGHPKDKAEDQDNEDNLFAYQASLFDKYINRMTQLKQWQKNRLKRCLIENLREYLVLQNKNEEQFLDFRLFQSRIDIIEMILIDRKTNMKCNLRVPQLQQTYENAYQSQALVDMGIDSVHINNNGQFIAILIKIASRIDRGNKLHYALAYCVNINTVSSFDQILNKDNQWNNNEKDDVPMKSPQKQASAFKDKISGFLNSRSKQQDDMALPHSQHAAQSASKVNLKAKIVPIDSNKILQDQQISNSSKQSYQFPVDVDWLDYQVPINSKIDFNISNKGDKAQKIQKVTRVNTVMEFKFISRPDLHSRYSDQRESQSLLIQMINLLQIDDLSDKYFIELQNIEIQDTTIIKSNSLNAFTSNDSQSAPKPLPSYNNYIHSNNLNTHSRLKQKQSHSSQFGQSNTVFTKIEYENDYSILNQEDQIVLRMSSSNESNSTDSCSQRMILNQKNISFMALNSSYLFYTKLFFIKYDESQIALQLDLFTMISAFEQPPTNPVTGKAQLLVDDAQWTPDGQFVLILLRGAQVSSSANTSDKNSHFLSIPGTLCILPRLGVSFIKILNPTRFNIQAQLDGTMQRFPQSSQAGMVGSSIAAKEDIIMQPQQLMQLIISSIVETKLKNISTYLNFHKKWKIQIHHQSEYGQHGQSDTKNIRLLISNGGEQIFEFQINYKNLIKDIKNVETIFGINKKQNGYLKKQTQQQLNLQKKIQDQNQLAFLRFCLTNQHIATNQDFIFNLPEILAEYLPLQHYNKIQDQYDRDFRQQFQQTLNSLANNQTTDGVLDILNFTSKNVTHKAFFQKTIRNSTANFQTTGSFYKTLTARRKQQESTKNEKYEPVKVLAQLQKLITICKWSDQIGNGSSSSSESQQQQQLSLNFKQWLMTIVNDCFYFLMSKEQPHLAFMALKISENYFCAKNDPNEFYIIKDISYMFNGAKMPVFQLEVDQILLNFDQMYDNIIQNLRDPQGQMYANCLIEQKLGTEQTLVDQVLPLNYPKNFYRDSNDKADDDRDDEVNESDTHHYQLLALRNIFQNHYSILIFYCMIQFRNYQATNFNILFLVIANFIFQRQVDPSYLRHYRQIMGIIAANYIERPKTNEYESFLGCADRLNKIMDDHDQLSLGCAGLLPIFAKQYQRFLGLASRASNSAGYQNNLISQTTINDFLSKYYIEQIYNDEQDLQEELIELQKQGEAIAADSQNQLMIFAEINPQCQNIMKCQEFLANFKHLNEKTEEHCLKYCSEQYQLETNHNHIEDEAMNGEEPSLIVSYLYHEMKSKQQAIDLQSAPQRNENQEFTSINHFHVAIFIELMIKSMKNCQSSQRKSQINEILKQQNLFVQQFIKIHSKLPNKNIYAAAGQSNIRQNYYNKMKTCLNSSNGGQSLMNKEQESLLYLLFAYNQQYHRLFQRLIYHSSCHRTHLGIYVASKELSKQWQVRIYYQSIYHRLLANYRRAEYDWYLSKGFQFANEQVSTPRNQKQRNKYNVYRHMLHLYFINSSVAEAIGRQKNTIQSDKKKSKKDQKQKKQENSGSEAMNDDTNFLQNDHEIGKVYNEIDGIFKDIKEQNNILTIQISQNEENLYDIILGFQNLIQKQISKNEKGKPINLELFNLILSSVPSSTVNIICQKVNAECFADLRIVLQYLANTLVRSLVSNSSSPGRQATFSPGVNSYNNNKYLHFQKSTKDHTQTENSFQLAHAFLKMTVGQELTKYLPLVINQSLAWSSRTGIKQQSKQEKLQSKINNKLEVKLYECLEMIIISLIRSNYSFNDLIHQLEELKNEQPQVNEMMLVKQFKQLEQKFNQIQKKDGRIQMLKQVVDIIKTLIMIERSRYKIYFLNQIKLDSINADQAEIIGVQSSANQDKDEKDILYCFHQIEYVSYIFNLSNYHSSDADQLDKWPLQIKLADSQELIELAMREIKDIFNSHKHVLFKLTAQDQTVVTPLCKQYVALLRRLSGVVLNENCLNTMNYLVQDIIRSYVACKSAFNLGPNDQIRCFQDIKSVLGDSLKQEASKTSEDGISIELLQGIISGQQQMSEKENKEAQTKSSKYRKELLKCYQECYGFKFAGRQNQIDQQFQQEELALNKLLGIELSSLDCDFADEHQYCRFLCKSFTYIDPVDNMPKYPILHKQPIADICLRYGQMNDLSLESKKLLKQIDECVNVHNILEETYKQEELQQRNLYSAAHSKLFGGLLKPFTMNEWIELDAAVNNNKLQHQLNQTSACFQLEDVDESYEARRQLKSDRHSLNASRLTQLILALLNKDMVQHAPSEANAQEKQLLQQPAEKQNNDPEITENKNRLNHSMRMKRLGKVVEVQQPIPMDGIELSKIELEEQKDEVSQQFLDFQAFTSNKEKGLEVPQPERQRQGCNNKQSSQEKKKPFELFVLNGALKSRKAATYNKENNKSQGGEQQLQLSSLDQNIRPYKLLKIALKHDSTKEPGNGDGRQSDNHQLTVTHIVQQPRSIDSANLQRAAIQSQLALMMSMVHESAKPGGQQAIHNHR